MSTTDLQEIPDTLEDRIFMGTIIRILNNTRTKDEFYTACHADAGSLCFTNKDGKDFIVDFEQYSGSVIEKDGELFIEFWSKGADWDLMLDPDFAVPTTWDQLSEDYTLTEVNYNVFLAEDEEHFIGFVVDQLELFTYSDEARDYIKLYEAKKEDLVPINQHHAQSGKL